jgi:adenosylhomocysteine nucleosidase
MGVAAFGLLLCGLLRAGDDAKPAPLTAILGAMEKEVNMLREKLTAPETIVIQKRKFVVGMLGKRRVMVVKTGIGKVNSAATAILVLERFNPSEVLVTGISGGLHKELGPGDIIIAEKTAQHDYGDLTANGMQREGTRSPVTGQRNPVLIPGDARLLAVAEAAAKRVKITPFETRNGPRTPAIRKGIVVTGDVFVADPAKSAELHKSLNADAVEMEGAAVAQICHQQDVPCLVIRSISDMADADAVADAASFGHIAAANSAAFVEEIANALAEQPAAKPAP